MHEMVIQYPDGTKVQFFCRDPQKDPLCGADKTFDGDQRTKVDGISVNDVSALYPLQASLKTAVGIIAKDRDAEKEYLEYKTGRPSYAQQATLGRNQQMTHHKIQSAKSLYILARQEVRNTRLQPGQIIVDWDGAAAEALRPEGSKADLDEIADMIQDRQSGKERLLELYQSVMGPQIVAGNASGPLIAIARSRASVPV